ncbi:6274_t:CDS:1, partial [Cetraspora pellucida]
MKVFQTIKKIYKKLKGISDINKNNSDFQYLFFEYYQVFSKSNFLNQYDCCCIGYIMKPKKKIQLKHIKKVVQDDLKEGINITSNVGYIAINAEITKFAF